MEFLHAFVSDLLQTRREVTVFAVDDQVDRSLRVFQEKDEASDIEGMPGSRDR
jgi:hypothetical protein